MATALLPTTTYKTHTPETNFGTITTWLPLTTAFPLPAGCSSSIWARWGFNVTANFGAVVFDPGYGITVDTAVNCVPDAVTRWWETEDASLTAAGIMTRYSVGPLVCPEAYREVGTSVVNSASTQVACCPLGYGFRSLFSPGIVGECTSSVSAGAVITYAMMNTPGNTLGGVKFTSTTMASAYYLLGVPINGMLFGAETISSTPLSSPGTSISISSSTSTPAASSSSKMGLSTGAKAGIGAGIAIFALVFILLIIWFFFLRGRSARYNAKVPMPDGHELDGVKGPTSPYELHDHGQHPELHGNSRYPELAGGHQAHELAG